ncbi:MAG: hypothetical protein IJ131_09175, partial [Eggerthellaceae bacterium]|nr:hypothetical protein [Eggerthellaceae bacterium]
MTELLKEAFDRVWGKYISLLILFPICVLGTLGLIRTDGNPLQATDYIIIATIAFVYLTYTVFVFYSNRLPRAKTVNRTILFV